MSVNIPARTEMIREIFDLMSNIIALLEERYKNSELREEKYTTEILLTFEEYNYEFWGAFIFGYDFQNEEMYIDMQHHIVDYKSCEFISNNEKDQSCEKLMEDKKEIKEITFILPSIVLPFLKIAKLEYHIDILKELRVKLNETMIELV